ncbi:MAG: coenzyme A pyrophosphatase [Pelagibacterales bacterium]|nr:coenzyme A pyrophosphatase [Pelagibacterales bacterium]|tara:strand:+ start:6806 stop:7414 length:609 start_codon:yes stop_codon:yes gene_type:complete
MNKFCLNIKKELANRHNNIIADMNLNNNKKNINLDSNSYKIAAVLFPLIEKNNELKVILTTRSKDLPSHPGQVCFPGGKLEKTDKNIIECAKRESFEEVGIKSDQINLLGQLDDCITGTNFKVTPVIGLIDSNYIPVLQEKEVADIFEVPLDYFIEKNNQKIEYANYKNKSYSYYQYNWNNKKIWGSTARIIVNFCEIMNLY